jgi:uncharacterized protein (TIGR02647 family)
MLQTSGIHMSYTPENRAEPVIAAAERLFEGGFITQVDGGYLTPLGSTAAEHAHLLFDMLNARIEQ